jgi:hypothetical protein
MGCSNSVDRDYVLAVASSGYRGDVVCERDRTAFLFDWDDTLFPSTWLKANLEVPADRLRSNPAVKSHHRRLLALLTAATKIGHVFIVTAAHRGFVQKACAVLYPDLYRKLQELGVTILYSRPDTTAAPVEEDKAKMFSLALGHLRPIPPTTARFYAQDLLSPKSTGTFSIADNWDQVFSIGDAWEDLTALKAALRHQPSCTKLVKFKDDPALAELTKEIALLTEYLPKLVGIDRSLMVDMEKPLAEQVSPLCERVCEFTLSFEPKDVAFPHGTKRVFPASVDSCSTLASTDDGDVDSDG